MAKNEFSHAQKRGLLLLQVLLLLTLLILFVTSQLAAQSDQPAAALTTTTPSSTPTNTPTATLTVTPTMTATPTATGSPPPAEPPEPLFLPVIANPGLTTQVPPLRVQEEPPIDFGARRAAAQAQGLDISFNKIGFHVGIGGNRQGLDEWMAELDAAGVPVFLKTANDAEPVYLAQQLAIASGVPHILVYRDARSLYDIPRYDLPPAEAAQLSWNLNKAVFPPELDPALVWLETVNEPDRTKSEWLAEFSLATAKLAVADGYKYAAFSWAPGHPEPESWETPEMLEFLRFAGDHPDQIAIAVHEYSLLTDYISNVYPWLVGRFQKLFAVCDKHGIPRPTVLITEWGWEYNHVPTVDEAMEDILWASWLYAAYPEVKGAAIWYLGEGGGEFGSIHDEAQRLIAPIKDFSQSNYYLIQPGAAPINEDLFVPNPPTGFPKQWRLPVAPQARLE